VVQLAGELTERELAAGESLLIHHGHLAMFTNGMDGPGTVWLRSMTPAALAAAIQPYLPKPTSSDSD
jgi:uncharacterized protein (AIM24 family)